MRCVVLWLRVAVIGLICGMVLCHSVRADDSVAQEVPPGTLERSRSEEASSRDSSETVATEVPAGEIEETPAAEPGSFSSLAEELAYRLEQGQAALKSMGLALQASVDGTAERERVKSEQAAAMSGQRDLLMSLDHRLLESLAANPDPQTEGHGEIQTMRKELFGLLKRIDYAVITLDKEAGSVFDIQNDTKSALTPPSIASQMVDTPWGGQTQKEMGEKNTWEYEGDLTWGGGHATNAENDYTEFNLVETLSTPSGNEFSFYQGYSLDHSYVNSREFVIGGEQRFDGLWWDGDLRLTEEFALYRDIDEPLNDRQDGLFKMKFNPQWSEGRWKLDLDYKYNIKEYETFSERSNIQHSGKMKVTRKFSNDLTGDVAAKYDLYNYSIGSTRGNRRYGVSSAWQWQVNDDLKLTGGVAQEHKSNNVRKTRDYDQLKYDASIRYNPDDLSTVEVRGGFTNYQREFDPEENYDDGQITATYRRTLSSKVDIDLRVSERMKDFVVDPQDNVDTHSRGASLNYNPTENWNMRLNYDQYEYVYANDARTYDNSSFGFASSYSWDEFRFGFDYRRDENSYLTDTDRDYTRDDMNFDLDYSLEDQRLRVYYGVGQTDQADPASVNDFTETRLGAGWDFELDPDTDLSLSYDISKRDYDAQETLEDARFEARLSFRF